MQKIKKEFNTRLYAIITFVAVAALLAVICVSTFKARYTGFNPHELAMTYVDAIVQSGDGYNAYKNTILSKNDKYGDFIRTNYINPAIYRDTEYSIGDDTDGYVGYNDESYMSDSTKNDDGSLAGQVIDEMYPFYEKLVFTYGWDNYDYIFSNYLGKLIEVRYAVFGDNYLTDEIFFTAFEANVATYADKLKGTEDIFDENTGVQLMYASVGKYEEAYGQDYKFTTKVESEIDISKDSYNVYVDEELFKVYGVNIDDISAVKNITLEVWLNDSEVVDIINVTTVKIGSTWYVDNTMTDTSSLYLLHR